MLKYLALPILVLIIILGGYFAWRTSVSPVNTRDSSSHNFLIVKGQSVGKIGDNLEKEGVIRNSTVFKIYVKLTGRDKSIQTGQYKLSPNLSLEQVIMTLARGPQALWFTYPEGLRREEVAARTIKNLDLSSEEAKVFWNEFMSESKGQEGYLFPDTYLFPKEATAGAVVRKMTETFDAKFTDQMKTDMQAGNLTQDEVVTMASIIERETRTDAERPVVAGILYNRLNAGIALQVDATLQYTVGSKTCATIASPWKDCNWWTVPTSDDKATRSAYNTYLNPGLPPGPIANPGLSSIKAAIYPEDSDYLFYLHGADGQIHYAKTGQEHLENIQKYL